MFLTQFLFGFILLVPQTFDVSTFAGRAPTGGSGDGIGNEASFSSIRAIGGHDGFLYVVDGTSLRKVNLATAEVSTVTKLAGTNFNTNTRWFQLGVKAVWADGSYGYVTDSGAGRVHRINLSTGLVEKIYPPATAGSPQRVNAPWGLWSDGSNLYVANAFAAVIERVNLATGNVEDFASPPGPTDPMRCVTGSDCIGYRHPSPTALAGSNGSLYAAGYARQPRRIDLNTREVSMLPELPFVPSLLAADGRYLYAGAGGQQIVRLDLGSGAISSIEPLPAVGYTGLWSDGRMLYASTSSVIYRIDPETGQRSVLAGFSSTARDGVGQAARFVGPNGIWGDGANLYVSDSAARLVRKVDIGTASVTSLPSFDSDTHAVWGEGTTLFVTDGSGIHQVDLSIQSRRLFAAGVTGDGMWGNGASIYVANSAAATIRHVDRATGESRIVAGADRQSAHRDGVGTDARFRQPTGVWGDSSYLYIDDRDTVRRMSLSTFEVTLLAQIHGSSLEGIWGDGENLWITDVLSGGGLWKVSASSGAFERATVANGPEAGLPTRFAGRGIWGSGQNLICRQQRVYSETHAKPA